jgi:hypothetical protein
MIGLVVRIYGEPFFDPSRILGGSAALPFRYEKNPSRTFEKNSGARKITNKCKICKYCGNTSYTTLQMPLSGRGFENCQVPKWLKYVNMLKLDKMVVWNGMGSNLGMCTSLKCQSMRKNGSNPPRTFGLARPD